MKTIQILLLLLGATTFSFAQKQFQGIITMKASGTQTVTSSYSEDGQVVSSNSNTEDFKVDMTFYMKGDVTVMDMPMDVGNMRAIMNYVTGEVTYITEVNGQRRINSMNYSNMQNHTTNEDPSSAKFKATGRTKTISGYKCLEYKVEDEDGSGTMWVAPELDYININERLLILKMKRNNNMGFLQFYDGIEGFVMEMRGKDKDGHPFKLDVTVEEKELQDALFKMPKVSKEQEKRISKEQKIRELTSEYQKKMMENRDNPDKMKELAEEFKKKIEALKDEN